MGSGIAAQFAQTWGLVFLIVMFLAAVAYALWPGNRGKFERAARSPLDEAAREAGREPPTPPGDQNNPTSE